MKSKSRVLSLAFTLALVTAMMVFCFLKSQGNKSITQKAHADSIAVTSSQPIEAGEIIKEEVLKMSAFPSSILTSDNVIEKKSITGKVAVEKIEPNRPITNRQVTARDASIGLSYAIPSGMRAVTVAVDSVIGVAGFLKPGYRVDILSTVSSSGITTTKTVLQNIKLLAVGEKVSEEKVGPGSGKPEHSQTVTLLVTPTGAQRLALYETKGKLRLSLRSSGDEVKIALQGTTIKETPSATTPPPPTPVTQSPQTKQKQNVTEKKSDETAPTRTLEIIRGTAKEVVTLPAKE